MYKRFLSISQIEKNKILNQWRIHGKEIWGVGSPGRPEIGVHTGQISEAKMITDYNLKSGINFLAWSVVIINIYKLRKFKNIIKLNLFIFIIALNYILNLKIFPKLYILKFFNIFHFIICIRFLKNMTLKAVFQRSGRSKDSNVPGSFSQEKVLKSCFIVCCDSVVCLP